MSNQAGKERIRFAHIDTQQRLVVWVCKQTQSRSMMSNVMKAVQISDFGGQNVLALNTVDIPTPKVDEVLIKVRAASVNPVDWKIREGYLQPLLNHSLPLTLG
ncbi:hypothetical protein P4S70_23475 [Enterovibrio sp. Hal110]